MPSTLLCAVVKGLSYSDVAAQVARAQSCADLIEWRFDLFSSIDLNQAAAIKKNVSIPSLFTLRAAREGGNFKGTEEERLETIQQLAFLQPEYFDLEWDVPEEFIKKILQKHPNIKIILSYHDFQSCPEELDQILQKMQQKPAHLYKMAFFANSTLDAMRLLLFAKKHENLAAMCMGDHGQLTRIAGPLFGSRLCYAALDENQGTASGQLGVCELKERYHFATLSSSTKLFGLIGDPVDKSLSHHTHNQTMQLLGLDSLYVWMQVKEQELAQCLDYAAEMGFSGLSVTMPLKEKIVSCLDSIDPEAEKIGAVNTIVFNQQKSRGYNTDGIGALNSIQENGPVAGKTLLILGAGGASRAIAFEAVKKRSESGFAQSHA